MRLHFATVPIHDGRAEEDELNRFLAAHRVVGIERHFVADGVRSAWAVCVAWVDAEPPRAGPPRAEGKKERVDYRELLEPEQFATYAKLREVRKRLAERDGVPPYAVVTNEQMAEMVRRQVQTLAEVARIDGVGPARLERYGVVLLEVLQTSTQDSANSTPA